MVSEKISDNKILYVSPKECLSYSKGWLFYEDKNGNVKRVFVGSYKSKSRLVERLLRESPRCAAKIDANSFIVSLHGKVIKYCINNNKSDYS